MSDAEHTILSSSKDLKGDSPPGQPPGEPKRRNPLIIIGGIGCALLLCAALLIGGGFFFARDQISSVVPGLSSEEEPAVAPSPTEAATATDTPEPESVDAGSSDETETEEPAPDDSAAAEPAGEPEIGAITFALDATEDYEPIDPGTSFGGEVPEIHAIFEYSGLSPDYSWTRVWYLDGNEMLNSTETWSGAEVGVFDYFINAGGEPLAPGEWVLELFVEDELLATGSFTIVGEEAPAAADAGSVEDSEGTAEAIAEPSPTATVTPSPTATSRPSSSASTSSGTYKLAFTRWDGGRHNLYIGDTSGGPDQFIMHNAAGPSWSADGQSIFFYGEPGVNRQDRSDFSGVGSCELPGVSDGIVAIALPSPPNDICVDQTSVYQGSGWNDGTARWASVSPNGSMVAYDAKPGGNYRIYFLGTAGNQQYNFEILGEQADWSPDSQKLVYRSGRDGKTGIWISNRDDSGHTLITSGNDSFPAWSFDGRTIAFARDEGGNVDIYTVNVDGTNLQRLTEAAGPDTLPTFTPGGQIIFRTARSGSWGVWKMNGDGSNQQELYPNAGVGNDWSYSKMDVLP